MMFDLKGKLALITGSSRGLGYTFAEGLGKPGAEILAALSPRIIPGVDCCKTNQTFVVFYYLEPRKSRSGKIAS